MVSFRVAVSLWWSFTWRLLLYGLPFMVAMGFLSQVLAPGDFERQVAYSYAGGLATWLPISMIAIHRATATHAPGLTMTIKLTLSIWWSFVWRATLYAAIVGFVLGLIVGLVVGRASEHPGFLILAWLLSIGPLAMFAIGKAFWVNQPRPTVNAIVS
jgi:hypothetical protein